MKTNRYFDVYWNKNGFDPHLWQIFLLSLFFSQVRSQCSYIQSQKFLNCRNENLTSVPINIPPETKIIDLSQNYIHKLEKTSFNNCTLVTELYLSENKLSQIHYGAFHNLNDLQILDVSNNLLKNFPVDTPISLEILYLDHNPLSNEYIFQQRLQFLKYLSLVGTGLTKPVIFSNFLPVLEYLDLSDNPSLSISTEDFKKLPHLRILYLPPRIFGGRSKSRMCREFIQQSKKLNVEVKSFACYQDEKFEINGRSFERKYETIESSDDRADDIISLEERNETRIYDLQTLVSNGMKNFIKSLIVKNNETTASAFKIKDSIKLEDYSIGNRGIRLYDVYMTGFPVFKMQKKPIFTVASSDAELFKYFEVSYETSENENHILISGKFNVEYQFANFSCKFSETNYKVVRRMVRRYDFSVKPTSIKETLFFEKMDCSTSLSNQHVDKVIETVLWAMSKNWLDIVSNVATMGVIGPALTTVSMESITLLRGYRNELLKKVIGHGITYLKNVGINSFDISPALYLKEQGADLDTQGIIYNVKIYNLFDYNYYHVNYTTENQKYDMKIFVKTVITYDGKNIVKLAITSKSDPSDIMDMYINNIEFISTFEIQSINKVKRLNIGDIKVNIVEKDLKTSQFFTLIIKKYLGIELANEFKRSLRFLMNKINFYSLNVM